MSTNLEREVELIGYCYDVAYQISDMRSHVTRGWNGRTIVDDIEIEILWVNGYPAEMFSPELLKLLAEEMYQDALDDAREHYEWAHLGDEMDAAYENLLG